MLHLHPEATPDARPEAYAEAVSRLASVRHALRLVDPFAGGPASDIEDDAPLAAAWDEADEAKRRWFDNRSARLVGATAAGVEVLLDLRQNGAEPHAEASGELVDQIRRELAQVARIVLGRSTTASD
jgi:hypothetical protein